MSQSVKSSCTDRSRNKGSSLCPKKEYIIDLWEEGSIASEDGKAIRRIVGNVLQQNQTRLLHMTPSPFAATMTPTHDAGTRSERVGTASTPLQSSSAAPKETGSQDLTRSPPSEATSPVHAKTEAAGTVSVHHAKGVVHSA